MNLSTLTSSNDWSLPRPIPTRSARDVHPNYAALREHERQAEPVRVRDGSDRPRVLPVHAIEPDHARRRTESTQDLIRRREANITKCRAFLTRLELNQCSNCGPIDLTCNFVEFVRRRDVGYRSRRLLGHESQLSDRALELANCLRQRVDRSGWRRAYLDSFAGCGQL